MHRVLSEINHQYETILPLFMLMKQHQFGARYITPTVAKRRNNATLTKVKKLCGYLDKKILLSGWCSGQSWLSEEMISSSSMMVERRRCLPLSHALGLSYGLLLQSYCSVIYGFSFFAEAFKITQQSLVHFLFNDLTNIFSKIKAN